jgi:formylglycine-generating enzyme required for sulfatase activity
MPSLPLGQKVLLVLDQFEQWLHAKRNEENKELVQALRHCDGGRLLCIVMVRDDFWLAVSRFLAELEIELVQSKNMALVDLFDPRHAKKVLAAFGRAFGTLPERPAELPKAEEAFLDQAVSSLSQDSKVISVRLALFAEMVKGKPWTPATLKAVGGMEGVGINFLEETFAAPTAPPQHRIHQKAAQAVLSALLPQQGSDIKGQMHSHADLLEASGYAGRLRDFDALLRILDSELRLITPTDPEGFDFEKAGSTNAVAGERYYQLTHDYLVHSLRDWLTRKQKETRRGRAELLLADRAAVWNARPENRQLPSLPQWLSIRWWTRKKNWTPPQRKMMGKATSYQALRASVLTFVLLLMCWGLWEGLGYMNATAHVRELVAAETVDVERYLKEVAAYDRWAGPQLLQQAAESNSDLKARLHASLALALLHHDDSQLPYLRERMLAASPDELVVLRDLLHAKAVVLEPELWKVLGDGSQPRGRRFRAAGALAAYTPEDKRWQPIVRDVAEWLVRENPYYLRAWTQAFKPARLVLLEPLREVFHSTKSSETERTLATNLLADYAADQPQLMADLLMDADEKQFGELFPRFKENGDKGLLLLTGEIERKLPPNAKDDAKETLAKRQANAAVALLRMNQLAKIWPLLQHSPDPRVRSYLIHRLSLLGADAKAIVIQLEHEKEISIRRALILCLGEFAEKNFTLDERTSLLEKLQESYRTERDPGLHASVEWLLRRWKEEAWLKQVNNDWAKDKDGRQKRLDGIQQLVTKDKEQTPQWYVNSQGQTMVMIPAPVQFSMGSPPLEAGRSPNEEVHPQRIGRSFAIASTPVTVEQFRRFWKANPETQHTFNSGQAEGFLRKYSPEETCPIVIVSWYMAAEYCNWLSKEEGIPEEEWCYEPEMTDATALIASITCLMVSSSGPTSLLAASSLTPGRSASGKFGDGMGLKRDYLQRTGYRLPTEAEWEYACRARAITSRYYGESEALLGEYAWYQANGSDRTWPVGGKKPNDLGLFDMHGNVWNWCQNEFRPYQGRKFVEDKEGNLIVNDKHSRVLRGGSFSTLESNVRTASRNSDTPTNRFNINGFRPSRTFTP